LVGEEGEGEEMALDIIVYALDGLVLDGPLKIARLQHGSMHVSTFLSGVAYVSGTGDDLVDALLDFKEAYLATLTGARCAKWILKERE